MDVFKWKMPKCRTSQRLNFLSLFTVIGTILYAILSYKGLPEQIPIHFDLSGTADRWGHKRMIFIPIFVLSFVILSVYGVSKVLHYFHSGKLTEQDKSQFILLRKLFSIMNFILTLTLLYSTWMIVRVTHEKTAFEPWSLYIIFATFAIFTLWMVVALLRNSRKR